MRGLVAAPLGKQQQRDHNHGSSLKADAGEHHLILLKTRCAWTIDARFQVFLCRLEEGDNAAHERNNRRDGKTDDEDDEESVHAANLFIGHRNAKGKAPCP